MTDQIEIHETEFSSVRLERDDGGRTRVIPIDDHDVKEMEDASLWDKISDVVKEDRRVRVYVKRPVAAPPATPRWRYAAR